ncbi:MAG: NifU N-terminal domain-containing protein [Acidimicrobiia bacterium]
MPVHTDPTPNPNAMKFTVGQPVGGPATYVAGSDADDPAAGALLRLAGVVSVFMTADFVTVSKSSDSTWETLAPLCVEILTEHYD